MKTWGKGKRTDFVKRYIDTPKITEHFRFYAVFQISREILSEYLWNFGNTNIMFDCIFCSDGLIIRTIMGPKTNRRKKLIFGMPLKINCSKWSVDAGHDNVDIVQHSCAFV